MLKRSIEAFQDIFSNNKDFEADTVLDAYSDPENISFSDLPETASDIGNYDFNWDGDKFIGGFGDTKIFSVDYWTIRARSHQLFTENLYARGIIRRIITNLINTGIELESQPDNNLLKLNEDDLDTWAENVESLFSAWGMRKELSDIKGLKNWSQIQTEAKRAALVCGDVLVIIHVDPKTSLPKIELVPGNKVNSPLLDERRIPKGNIIKHGVEIDKKGAHVAFWVDQEDGSSKRIPAKGPKSGRRIAWLLYGTDYLMDEVRGQPLLAIVMQSLKEIDRYRDSAQRKALVNSFFSLVIEKSGPEISSGALGRMAADNQTAEVEDSNGTRNLNISKYMPGAIGELGTGEKLVPVGGEGTDVNFGEFEKVIIAGAAWCLEIPPEILLMSFDKNYSASQAALSEYRIILLCQRSEFGENMCQPVYEEFFTLQVLNGKIEAQGFVDAINDVDDWPIYSAWLRADWFGTIKPSADILKTVKAYETYVKNGFMTYAQACRELTGKKWRVVVKIQRRERALLNETLRVTADFESEFSGNTDSLMSLVRKVSEETAETISDNVVALVSNDQ